MASARFCSSFMQGGGEVFFRSGTLNFKSSIIRWYPSPFFWVLVANPKEGALSARWLLATTIVADFRF